MKQYFYMKSASVIAIGITEVVDKDILRLISSPPQIQGQNFFCVEDFIKLPEIRNAVIEGTCQAIQRRTSTQYIYG